MHKAPRFKALLCYPQGAVIQAAACQSWGIRPAGRWPNMRERRPAIAIDSGNRILAALPHAALAILKPHLIPVSLSRGKVLSEPDEPLSHVYFVERGAISLVTYFEDGTTAEMATVGREGLVGIGTLLGVQHALSCHIVPVPGSALAVGVSHFRAALRDSTDLRTACESYAQAFFAHLLQNVACNAAHSAEQRCARWLLMCADQAGEEEFKLTHESLAEMLGVRRSTVTVIASSLQQSGIIRYCRGRIDVVDRRRLGAVACECYQTVRTRYDSLLAAPAADATTLAEPVAGGMARRRFV